ncbi:MAG: type II secretion system F family protein [Planctomycetota bacterium]
MQQYQYQAVSFGGQTITGLAHAKNTLDLDRVLESKGLTLVKAKESKVGSALGGRRGFNRSELVFFTTQVATLMSAGVPMLAGLKGVGGRMRTRRGRVLVQRMVSSLEAGNSLSESLKEDPKSFPDVTANACTPARSRAPCPKVLGPPFRLPRVDPRHARHHPAGPGLPRAADERHRRPRGGAPDLRAAASDETLPRRPRGPAARDPAGDGRIGLHGRQRRHARPRSRGGGGFDPGCASPTAHPALLRAPRPAHPALRRPGAHAGH